MKNLLGSIVTSFGSKSIRHALAVCVLGAALTGCENYTSAPLCDASNSVDPAQIPGFAGIYELTTQDEEFANTTEVYDLTESVRALTDHDMCWVDGHYYMQNADEYALGYWSYQRFSVTGTGISFHDMVFDRPSMDAAGVGSSTFVVPEKLHTLLGSDMSNLLTQSANDAIQLASTRLGLVVDNSNTSPEEILSYAKPLPVGLTLFRQ